MQRITAQVDRLLADLFPPTPNGVIVSETGGTENEYGENVGASATQIKVWILIAPAKTGQADLAAQPAGSDIVGAFDFTAKGTTRAPIAGDVILVDGVRWRVTSINPDSPRGNYVDGSVERIKS